MGDYFNLKYHRTNYRNEIQAGCSMFVSVAYILLLNPAVLSRCGMNYYSVFMATVITGALSTLFMALYVKMPIVVAPGLSMNGAFVFMTLNYFEGDYRITLLATYLAGVLFLLLLLTGAFRIIDRMIPWHVKYGVLVGLGIALIRTGIFSLSPWQAPFQKENLIVLLGLLLIFYLHKKKVHGAIFYGLLLCALFCCPLFAVLEKENFLSELRIFFHPAEIFEKFQWDGEVFFQDCFRFPALDLFLERPELFHRLILATLSFTLLHFTDALGTTSSLFTFLTDRAVLLPEEYKEKAMYANGASAVLSGLLGTSTATSIAESIVGITEGARTGVAGITVSVLFLLSGILYPRVLMIPEVIAIPAVLTAGALSLTVYRRGDGSGYRLKFCGGSRIFLRHAAASRHQCLSEVDREMKLFTSFLLFIQSYISLELVWEILRKENSNRRENAALILEFLAIFVWNIAWLIQLNSLDEQLSLRYACRNIEMMASIVAVIFCHYVLMLGSSFNRVWTERIMKMEIGLGLLVYPLATAREAIQFEKAAFGWSYHVLKFSGRGFYSVYSILVQLLMLGMCVYTLLRGQRRKERLFGLYGIFYVFLMGLAMLLETVIPIPLTEGLVYPWSVTVMTICGILNYYLTIRLNVSKLTVSNVSPQIFNHIDMPMLVTDEEGKISLMNRAAGIFLQTASERIIDHPIQDFFDVDMKEVKTGEPSLDLKCRSNGRDCRLQLSEVTNAYQEPLGTIFMISDMTDKIHLIHELEEYRGNLQEELGEKTQELETLTLQAITAVANTIDAKDKYTKGHSLRVANYASQLARKLRKSESYITNLSYMALLHDIGKIGVPDAVLNKPGRLNETEFGLIKKHAVIGGEILKDITMIEGVALGAKYHHEKYDGSGYPSGLKGEEIPYEARIIGIADAFDAMTSNRVYRGKISMDQVIEQFEKNAGTQFDPKMAAVFVEMLRSGELQIEEAQANENRFAEESNKLLQELIEQRAEQDAAEYDYMTKLYNRHHAERQIREELRRKGGVLLLLDLDHFREINEKYGHLMGDWALRKLAAFLQKEAPENAILGRQGGDEFLLFLTGCEDREQATAIAEELRKKYLIFQEKESLLEGTSLSIGISELEKKERDYERLFRQADKALYSVKNSGGNHVELYYRSALRRQDPASLNQSIEQVLELLRRPKSYQGAFPVKGEELRRMFEFSKNFAARYHYEMQLVLFTMGWDFSSSTLEERESTIQLFQKAIAHSLRTVDISTRYGSSQIIVILMDTKDENVSVVTQRIIENFYKMHTGAPLEVFCDSVNAREIAY